MAQNTLQEERENDSEAIHVDRNTLRKIHHSGTPDSELSFHVGMEVMLLRNLAPEEGPVNGARGVIVKLEERIITVNFQGKNHLIPRIYFTIPFGKSRLHVVRRQFPLRAAYAMAIHKSQGQTLDCVLVDLRDQVFTAGMLYVEKKRSIIFD